MTGGGGTVRASTASACPCSITDRATPSTSSYSFPCSMNSPPKLREPLTQRMRTACVVSFGRLSVRRPENRVRTVRGWVDVTGRLGEGLRGAGEFRGSKDAFTWPLRLEIPAQNRPDEDGPAGLVQGPVIAHHGVDGLHEVEELPAGVG